ncbi:MAG: GMC family oxidoreductase [Actinomycetales bacterium]|nr:GMC family oxidoreductase [Actinomycetales bacterium]
MEHYDVVVIGSGFGGSVAALRLTERGYRVLVVEAGARFHDQDFAKTSWNVRKFLFFPRLGCTGIQRMDLLSNVLVLSGAGVGGGSLVYANTLYRPSDAFFSSGTWAGVTDWKSLLEPHYRQAEVMLGVVTNPFESNSDRVLRKVAEAEGFGDTYTPTPVGVYFGEGSGVASADPFFGGAGPARSGCLNCGECMTGCRHNAKNTLVKNYLHLAESGGAQVWPLTTVTDLQRSDSGWTVSTRATARGGRIAEVRAEQVIVAAGALGTAKLLQKLRANGRLPGLSDQLGANTRTNSESLLGVISKTSEVDYSEGSAITSSVYPSPDTHIESVRYGRGSNLMATLQAFMASGKYGENPSVGRVLWATLRNLHNLPRFYNFRHWSERTLILLVMQARDNSLTTYLKRGVFGSKLVSKQGHGEPNPSWVPAGHKFARALAAEMNGIPGAVATEALGIPLTAHFLGGATIGATARDGVVDGYLRVFGEPGLHIFDGSTLSANPGVNPSLSITAQAEWACSVWPNKGATDARPALGSQFELVEATQPLSPLVPAHAPAALRLPIR